MDTYKLDGKIVFPFCTSGGTEITIPANVKHWHGAKKDSWFSHLAIEVPGIDTKNEWCEPVSNEEYDKLNNLLS